MPWPLLSFWKWKWRWKRSFPRPKPPAGLTSLPPELILLITDHLRDDIDYLCLALSCKPLLHFLIVDLEGLQQSELFRDSNIAAQSWPFNDNNMKLKTDRWKLLGRLEDSYWRRCAGCVKLHPVHEFSQRKNPPTTKGLNLTQTCCSVYGPLVGLVRLCPCITITFRDKIKIVKVLSSLERKEEKKLESPRLDSLLTKGYHKCTHLRTFQTQHDTEEIAWVTIQLSLFLKGPNRDDLVAETRYTITGLDLLDTRRWFGMVLICPHREVNRHIQETEQLHARYKDRWGRWQYYSNGRRRKFASESMEMSCPWCGTTSFDSQWSRARKRRVRAGDFITGNEDVCRFTTERNLGSALTQADEVWYQQTETAFEALPSKRRRDEGFASASWIDRN